MRTGVIGFGFAALFTVFNLAGCGGNESQPVQVDAPVAGQTIQQYLDAQQFSGAVHIAVDDTVIFSQGFGFAARQQAIANTTQTIFRIASLSKQFTAAAILLLNQQQRLSIDDPISSYLTNFPNGDKISLRQLLNHTSGLVDYTSLAEFQRQQSHSMTPAELIDLFKDKPLQFEPGTEFSYSNSGYVVLGAIIEQLTQLSYQQYLEQNILLPLGLFDTHYAANQPDVSNHALGYKADGTEASFVDMSLPYAAGALESTVTDLAHWDDALYSNSLLNEEAAALMFTPALNGYAMGWAYSHMTDSNENVYMHVGRINGFSAAIYRFPDSKKRIIILSNTQGYPVTDLAKHLNNLMMY